VKKNEVHVGKTYIVKVSNKEQPVKIIDKTPSGYMGINQNTGRKVRFKTAAKCRREVS
jgi:hypothetical protein